MASQWDDALKQLSDGFWAQQDGIETPAAVSMPYFDVGRQDGLAPWPEQRGGGNEAMAQHMYDRMMDGMTRALDLMENRMRPGFAAGGAVMGNNTGALHNTMAELSGAIREMAASQQAMAASQKSLADRMSAPREIMRDANGRAVGVKMGEVSTEPAIKVTIADK